MFQFLCGSGGIIGASGFSYNFTRLGFVSGSLIPDLHMGDFLQAAKDVPVSAKVR